MSQIIRETGLSGREVQVQRAKTCKHKKKHFSSPKPDTEEGLSFSHVNKVSINSRNYISLRLMNVWTRIELAVKSTSRHSPLPWVPSGYAHRRARATLDTNTLTASSRARTTNVQYAVRASGTLTYRASWFLIIRSRRLRCGGWECEHAACF